MTKTYSISEARGNLAELVHKAEEGQPVELTRRGHAVAAIVSIEDFQAFREKRQFFELLSDFLAKSGGVRLDQDDLAKLREPAAGRDNTWQ